MAGGWIKLHRKIIDSAVFANPELLRLWIVCLMNANRKDKHVHVDGLNEPVLVKRGQFITGRFALHADVYPRRKGRKSRARDGAQKTPITVWRWLETLQKLHCVVIETNNRFSLVTVDKYDTYQKRDQPNDQPNDQQMISRRSTDDQQMITNKKDEEGIRKKKEENTGGTPPVPPKDSKRNPKPIEFPAVLQTPAFTEAWASWVKFRSEKRKPLTPSTIEAQVAKLAAWGSDRAVASIRQSIEHGWQGLFEVANAPLKLAETGKDDFAAIVARQEKAREQEAREKAEMEARRASGEPGLLARMRTQ